MDIPDGRSRPRPGGRKPRKKGFDRIVEESKADGDVIKVTDVDLFAPTLTKPSKRSPTGEKSGKRGKTIVVDTGGLDKLAHDTGILKVEWAVKHPHISAIEFLTEVKGYGLTQAKYIMEETGGVGEWEKERNVILDRMTETVVKRHIDLMAEVTETHVKASKVGLAKAIEYLSKLSIEPARDKEGKVIMDGKGKPVWKGYRSIDLLNIMASIEKAQAIYRKSMGLPNDESGMKQILEKVQQINQVNVQQNHLHIHEAPAAPKTELDKKAEQLSYDDLLEFIEFRREQKRIAESRQKDEEPAPTVVKTNT